MPVPQMDGFDAELNQQFANETSRSVKFCILKYRCVLMFTFMLLSFLQFLYIIFKEVWGQDELKEKLLLLVEKVVVSHNTTK
jgi:hypothetical protein